MKKPFNSFQQKQDILPVLTSGNENNFRNNLHDFLLLYCAQAFHLNSLEYKNKKLGSKTDYMDLA